MRAADWKLKGEIVDIGGNGIFTVQEESDNPVLLCLHGFPTSSFDYHKIWSALAEHSSLIAFDMIGYGFSDKPLNHPYTTSDQADLVEGVLEKFGVDEVHILSHDYGNTIVHELLARRAEGRSLPNIKSLCYMNGALFPETHRPILAQKLLIGPIGPLFGRMIPDRLFAKSLASVFGKDTQPSAEELEDFVSIFRTNNGKRIANRLIQYMKEREVFRERWLEALRSVDMPFRFINGLDDPVSGRHLLQRFRELIPEQQDIVELESIGHFPHLEKPEAVIRHYADFRENIFEKS